MSTPKLTDVHNLVAFLSKPTESEGFEQIIDFLNANPIKYALMVNPTIYTSCIEQFWVTAKAKNINGEAQIHTKKKQKPRKSKQKDTQETQPGDPTDEALNDIGRNIADIDADVETTLVNETAEDQGRYNAKEMFYINVLNDVVVVEDVNAASIETTITATATTALKNKSFDEVQKAFDKTMSWINSFVPMDSEVVKDKAVLTQESSSKRVERSIQVGSTTVNGEGQLQALVDGKKILITKSTIRRDLQLKDAEGVDCLPNSVIFEQLTLMGKPRRKVIEVPQPSDPTSFADETINEEMDDSLERAATTATSLNAKQGFSWGSGKDNDGLGLSTNLWVHGRDILYDIFGHNLLHEEFRIDFCNEIFKFLHQHGGIGIDVSSTGKNNGLFSPLKIDLSYSRLKVFQQPEFESYGPKSCKIESKNASKNIPNELKESTKVKEYSDVPLVKKLVSDDKLEKKVIVPNAAKVEFVKAKCGD
nr:hypothetical protein [Tanacetum cinerariifolium]